MDNRTSSVGFFQGERYVFVDKNTVFLNFTVF